MNDLIAQLLRASQHRIIGRIGNEPELKFFQSGTCKLQLSVAVNKPGAKRDDGQKPDWFKAELWGDEAQSAADTLHKGDLVDVTGRISTDTWTNRNGEQVTDLVVKVEQWAPIGGQAAKPAAPARATAPAPAAAAAAWGSSTGGFDDSEVPF
jgi:single-strand DNA-binding protein